MKSLSILSGLGAAACLLLCCACPAPPASQGAAPRGGEATKQKLEIVCTTSMLADAARQIGGDAVNVVGLMGPGVDPHLYKARPSDMDALRHADLVIYHGLHLEARLADVLEQLGQSRRTLAAAGELPQAELIYPEGAAGAADPHIWFDVELWMRVCERIGLELAELDRARAADYRQRTADYLLRLEELHAYVQQRAASIPANKRILVTAHDAFNYFGRSYGFTVVGLQGISTEAEAGTGDVQRLAQLIVDRNVPAIFVESSVPVRNIEALIAAARSKGHHVGIGGELFSDALGDSGSAAGDYVGMLRHNIDTIAKALGGGSG